MTSECAIIIVEMLAIVDLSDAIYQSGVCDDRLQPRVHNVPGAIQCHSPAQCL